MKIYFSNRILYVEFSLSAYKEISLENYYSWQENVAHEENFHQRLSISTISEK